MDLNSYVSDEKSYHLAVGIYHSEPSLFWRWSAVCVACSYVAHAKVQVGLYKLALDSATFNIFKCMQLSIPEGGLNSRRTAVSITTVVAE